MSGALKFTILGCGSSGGVPRLGGNWGECNPENPKNNRRRCALMVQRITDAGSTNVLIDTTPDMRNQLLDAGIAHMDAVIYTHAHADHTSGLDDLRQYALVQRAQVPVYADDLTRDSLLERFKYAFVQPEGSIYPAILKMNDLQQITRITGAGGAIDFMALDVDHGSMPAKGFRIGDLAYIPDVITIPDQTWPMLAGLDCWIIDALRRTPHATHTHLSNTIDWINKVKPKRAVITNMHIDLDYDDVMYETPDNTEPAYDGMTISYPL
ncbi:MAG: MBL fold metallo-hydrolase [Rhodobacterales bacterium]